MVNSEIGRGLYKAYRINGQRVGLQWVYSGSTTNKRRTMNEGTTNLSRRKVEAKAEIKRRLWVDFNLKSMLQFGIYKKTLLLCAFKKKNS